MLIGGYQPFTLSDYPGKVAAIVFTQGCNFQCPWCHNRQLISSMPTAPPLITEDSVFGDLSHRCNQLDGVVISGGEPTIQDTLPEFLARLKSRGYALKLDTNGSRPWMLRLLISRRLLDYIAMDVKALWEMYPQITGTSVSIDRIQESVRIIAESGIAHEFRTTRVPALSDMDIVAIRTMLPERSAHRIQPYQFPVAHLPAIPTSSHNRESPEFPCRPGNVAGRLHFTSP